MQCVTNRRLVTRFVNSCIQLISTDRLTHCGAHTPRLSRSGLLRRLELVLRHGFLLDRLPAVIRSKRSYPAMPLAGQLADQRFTIPGPLVQRNDSLNSLPPPALPILSHCLQCYGQSLIKGLVKGLATGEVTHPGKIGTVLPLGALNPTHVPL